MSSELGEYLRVAKELGEVNYELIMVNKLIEKAQTELDYSLLNKLRDYMSTLLQKLGELQARKIKLEEQLNKTKPPFIKVIDHAEAQVKHIKTVLSDVKSGKISISELWGEISASRNYIPKLLENLDKSKSIIERLIEKVGDEASMYLRTELERISSIETTLRKAAQATMLDPSIVIRYKRMIGSPVILEPSNEECVISEIYISGRGKIFFEISREANIDASTLDALFREIGFDFGATDINDFRSKLIRQMSVRIQKSQLKPSVVKQFLGVEGLLQYISPETKARLESKYEKIGYVPLDKISESAGGFRVNSNDIKKEPDNLLRCPSIRMLPERAIGRVLRLEGKYFYIISQTFIPLVGRVLVGLRQDTRGEPLPDLGLIEKILTYMSRKRDLDEAQSKNIAKAINLLSKKKLDEVYWMIRIMIAKSGIKVRGELTESNALRPAYVFAFALKYGIPLMYSEILSYYIYSINTDYVELVGKNLQVKLTIPAKPLSRIFNYKLLQVLVGIDCPEYLGMQTDEQNLIMLCAPRLSKDVLDSLKETYQISLDFATSASKLIKGLIYYNKIKTASEYTALLDSINVRRIKYNDIIADFSENEELIIAHTFLLDLMRNS